MSRILALTAIVSAVAAVGSIVLVPIEADSRKSYAKKEDKKCGHCHDNVYGGGPRNQVGLYYQATKTLPDNKTEQEIHTTIDNFMKEVARSTPDVVWSYEPLSAMPDAEPPKYEPAPDAVVLRRMSLDLRGRPPFPDEVRAINRKEVSLDDKLEEYLKTQDFLRTFRLYHRDILRPRTGIHNQGISWTRMLKADVDGQEVWYSPARRGEIQRGSCAKDKVVPVVPWWSSDNKPIKVCAESADPTIRIPAPDGSGTWTCGSYRGQRTGQCGCGPNLKFCYDPEVVQRKPVTQDMTWEYGRLAMEVVDKDLPYSTVLTSDWTMATGRMEYYYAKLSETINDLDNPRWDRTWRRVERPSRHAGILTSPSYLNFYFNGRRWAQRTFEAFMCHQTVPDYDLLDEHEDDPPVSYRSFPTQPPDINVNSGRACAACHLQLDGLSRVKDRWDWFGKYWTRAKGEELPHTIRFLGQEVTGVDEFGRALGNSEVFHDCATNQLWEHMTGRRFQPEEIRTRKRLVKQFEENNLNFKDLIRRVVRSDEYRDRRNVKIMERELYRRMIKQTTGINWIVRKKDGFDTYYDLVGGMDYRRIEERDRRPSQGHSLVLMKAAAEVCHLAMERDDDRDKDERKMLYMVQDDLDDAPTAKQWDVLLDVWSLRFHSRQGKDVSDEQKKIYRDLFDNVSKEHGTLDGYKAVCTTMIASADTALY